MPIVKVYLTDIHILSIKNENEIKKIKKLYDGLDATTKNTTNEK